MQASTAPLIGMLKRQWWVLAVTTAVAVAVAVVLSSSGETSYTSTVGIAVNQATVSSMIGVPVPERLLKELKTSAFNERVAKELGVPKAEVDAGLNIYTTGAPQDRVWVSYTSTDAAEAELRATAASEQVLAKVAEMSAPELGRYRSLLDSTNAAIAAVEEQSPATAWERADTAFKLWELRRDKTAAEYNLSLAESAYTLLPGVQTSQVSGTRALLTNAAGAAVLGLALGAGIALVRERAKAQG